MKHNAAARSTIRNLFVHLHDQVEEEDFEAAHLTERRIRAIALEAIKNGDENPKELAEMALLTENFDFPRWFA